MREDWSTITALRLPVSHQGVQSVGVIATIKHLIANEQETYRMYSLVKPGISSNLNDRTMHELYLWPFAEGVRAGVGSVMIAYNAVSQMLYNQVVLAEDFRSMGQLPHRTAT